MGDNPPKISVVTATYNSLATTKDAIDSVLIQSYQNIQLTVVDGGSSDGTIELLKSYGDKIHTLISEQDKGIYDALNKGIALATGDVVGFMHSDDLFHDQHVLKKIADQFASRNVDAVYGDLVYIDKNDPDKTPATPDEYTTQSMNGKLS